MSDAPPLIDFHFDFETRSRLNLKKVGAVRYAADLSTEATLLTWGFGRTGSVKAWRMGQQVPSDLLDVLLNPDKYNFIAYNIGFDYLIWTLPFTRQVSALSIFAKRPAVKNITDCMALSQHFRTGGSLAGTANMLDIPTSKDKEGRKIMLKQCKPNSRTGEFPTLTDEEWRDFERYGIIDTVILRDAYYKLPPLPAPERWIFEWTFKRNLTGIKIDTELVSEMDKIIKHYLPRLEQEFFAITGLKVKSSKCLGFFQPHFPWVKNMQADTVRDMQLRTAGVHPVVVRALELKALAGSTSISKVTAAVNMQINGRIYDLFAYHMAQTKRFAGRGIQIHNFPRPAHKPKDYIPKDLNIADLAGFVRNAAPTLQDPIDFVKNLLRRIWIVEEGHVLYCGDFSKVEPTVLHWLTGMPPISKTAYEEMAVHIYNMPLDQIGEDSEERTVGKAAELGCIAKGTKVLTHKGYVEIQNIRKDDLIWDGESNVTHEGLLIKGMKSVIRIASLGIESTPDHLFQSREGWVTAVELNEVENMKPLKLELYSVSGQLSGQSLGKVSSVMSLSAAYVGVKRLLESTNSGKEWMFLVGLAQVHSSGEGVLSLTGAATWLVTQGLEIVGTLASTTQRKGVRILKIKTGLAMEVEELPSSSNPFVSSWNILLRWMGLTNGVSRLTGLIMMDTMRPETYELLAKKSITRIEETYDIHNCGPNNRYILERGLAHNCGYGMGPDKFKDDTFKKTGIPLDINFARHAVKTYRKINRPIVELWRDLQAAFRKAINGEGSALCNRKVFVMPMPSPWKGVQIRLPSGSMLYYHKASVEVSIEETEIVEIINGLPTVRKISRAVENLFYMTEGNGGRPQKTKIYGGLLTEHVTSATARDLLTFSMYSLDQAGFDVLSTVHDETWGKQTPGRELEFQSTMCQLPYWCTDLQLTADLKCGVRYLK